MTNDQTESVETDDFDRCSFAQEIARRRRAYAASLSPRVTVATEGEPVDVLDCTCGRHIVMWRRKTEVECYGCHVIWTKADGRWTSGVTAPPLFVVACECGNRFPIYGTGTERTCFGCSRVWTFNGVAWVHRDTVTVGDAPVKGTGTNLKALVPATWGV